MSAYRDNLEARRLAISTELAALSGGGAGSKPSIKQADGGTHIDHVEYRLSLLKELDTIQGLITKFDQSGGDDDSTDGLEVVSYVES